MTATSNPSSPTLPDYEKVNYRKAINRALMHAMAADDRVVLLGEDVAAAGGVFKTTVGLHDRFGDRVRDTPIAEQAIVGTAIGAAMMGLRPVAEIMFADFAAVAFDQIANTLAKLRYMSGGQLTAPVTIRMCNGAGGGYASQHSQSVENWFLNTPGLKIAVPGSVEDVYGMLRAALLDADPVLVFEHKSLFEVSGEVPVEAAEQAIVPLGRAAIVAPGEDVTIVAVQLMRQRAVAARERLQAQGIAAEVIDPRTLVPLDLETIRESLRKTSRLLVVQEGAAAGSWGASLVASITTGDFELLDAPPALLSSADTPVPYARSLEDAWLPSVDAICEAAATLHRY